jgi:hypothetical protein
MKLPKPGGSRITPSLKAALQAGMNEDSMIITPALEEFLMANPNLTVDRQVSLALAKLMSTPQRDRRGSWSASSAGYCKRRQELNFLGVQAPRTISPQMQQIFFNGTWVHLRWQATLMTAGILDAVEVTVKKPQLRSRATLDGMGIASRGKYKGQDFGFELKGRNDFEYNKQFVAGVDENTRKQVDFQFYMSGLDVWSIINENKNNQGWKEWVIYRDEERVKAIAKDIHSMNAAIDRGRLHQMLPECKRREGEFNRCPFGGAGGPCVMSGSWPSNLGTV